MGVLRPIITAKTAFDASNESVFTYIVSGGNQIVKNKLVITDNDTSVVAYTNTETTYLSQQTVPARTLTNGHYYNYYFTVFDNLGNESLASNIVNFYCHTTPVFEFTNVNDDDTISASSYLFTMSYNQAQSEKMQYAVLNLIDNNNNIIDTSGNIYSTETPPFTISYEFKNFLDREDYTINATLYTIKGTLVETNVSFHVNYYASNIYTIVELENDCINGYVNVKNNMIIIDGTSNPSPPTYLENTKVDLSVDGSWVEWAGGYSVNGDFTLMSTLDIASLGDLLVMFNRNLDYTYNKIQLTVEQDYPYGEVALKYLVALRCWDGQCCAYSIYSNYVETLDNIYLWVRRINNIYEIKLEVLI